MPRIELNYLTANCVNDPERVNLLRHFYNTFDYRTTAGINRRIVNVEPLFYQGVIAGSEFLVYAATKLYITYKFEVTYTSDVPATALARIIFYNEANVFFFQLTNCSISYNTTAAALSISPNNGVSKNIYFARFEVARYAFMAFNGFRVTLD